MDTDFSNDADVRTMLLVHDTRPPFLDGRVIFTKQAEAIMPLRDPTSDLAVIAKTGSKLVKEIRDKKNEGKSRQRFWEVAGSKMGKITGECCTCQQCASCCAPDCANIRAVSTSITCVWVCNAQAKYDLHGKQCKQSLLLTVNSGRMLPVLAEQLTLQ